MNTIKLTNVYKDFNDGDLVINALKPTSFTINKNELIAIIGPSGSGKSTLLTMIGALQKPSGGKIYIDDIDISLLSDDQRSNLRFTKIGFILQASNLLTYLTLEEQFKLKARYSNKKYDKQKGEDILRTLGIINQINKYPSQLSGGEKQRAAIATALYGNPSLILADEPTASLDSVKAIEVAMLLKEIAKSQNKAVIMVTHDTRLLPFCDRILKIEDGNLDELV